MRNIFLTNGVQCIPRNRIRSMMVVYPKKQWQTEFLKNIKSDDLKFWEKITDDLVAPIVQKEVITLG